MKIPNVDRAQVRQGKIVDYLLSPTHRDGKAKNDFFIRFGFKPAQWEQLADALIQQIRESEITASQQTPFGTRYVIEGPLQCPDSRQPLIRSVWFIDAGEDIPRLVTAYPARG